MSNSPTMTDSFTPRHAEQLIRVALADTRIVALVGPRQSGKTTLVRRVADVDQRSFVSLDDTQSRTFAQEDPIGFLRGLQNGVIDEIQRAPNLILELKREVDERPEPGRFLITGSADLFRSSTSPDSLAGRVETVKLMPLSQAEVAREPIPLFLERAFDNDFPRLESIGVTSNLVERVLGGGYPTALSRSDPMRRRAWLREYGRASTERDVSDIANVTKRNEMSRLMAYAAHMSGQLLNFSRIGSQIGVNGHTAARWLDLFEHMFLLQLVPAWHQSGLKRLVKTSKLQFLDSGLLASLQGVGTEEIADNRQLLGPLLESFVYSELIKTISYSNDEINVFHYRRNNVSEVDFVVERSPRELVGIEVKASATVYPDDFKGLIDLRESTGRRFVCGIVLYDGERIQQYASDLYAMPFKMLWAH